LVPGTVPVTGFVGIADAGDAAGDGSVAGISLAVVPSVSLQAARPSSRAAAAAAFMMRAVVIAIPPLNDASAETGLPGPTDDSCKAI